MLVGFPDKDLSQNHGLSAHIHGIGYLQSLCAAKQWATIHSLWTNTPQLSWLCDPFKLGAQKKTIKTDHFPMNFIIPKLFPNMLISRGHLLCLMAMGLSALERVGICKLVQSWGFFGFFVPVRVCVSRCQPSRGIPGPRWTAEKKVLNYFSL